MISHLLLRRHLTTVTTTAAVTTTVKTTAPIHPWPENLTGNRLETLISRQKDPTLSLQIFHYAAAHHPHLAHTSAVYASLLTRLSRARLFRHVDSLLQLLRQHSDHLKPSESLFCTLINHYGLARQPSEAVSVFAQIPNFNCPRTLRSFNCLLNVLVNNRMFDKVYALFKNCRQKFGLMPNLITCNILIKGLCRKYDLGNAQKVLDEMHGLGICPNLVSYTTILDGFVRKGDLVGARRVFEGILERGYRLDATTYTVMIDGYCRVGRLGEAVRVMDEMEAEGVRANGVTYGVVIEAYCREKKGGEAVRLLEDMLEKRVRVSSVLCGKVVDVLCEGGRVEDACEVWRKCLKANKGRVSRVDDGAVSTLVHWLCKEGKVREARRLFDEFEKGEVVPSLLTYNMLIERLCEVGELSEVRWLWEYMVENGCSPNAFTYNVLIKGLCKCGDPEEGMRVFEEMLEKGCLPNESTYRVLIEELCSSGLDTELMKLLSVVVERGGKLDARTWEVILSKALAHVDTRKVLDNILPDSQPPSIFLPLPRAFH
ncbi:hypothetical protein vseg_004383 [Gypsophila vaccaria]